MNNRLQVGGLALEMSSGAIVKLIMFKGDGYCRLGKIHFAVWLVSSSDPVFMPDTGLYKTEFHAESKDLMPLGDKQTQDELEEERENEIKQTFFSNASLQSSLYK